MNDWASRRKNIYLALIVFVLSGASFALFWNFWYKTPTCSDGIQNGGETGVDCGGSCSLVCKASAIRPIVRWDPRLFEINPGIWSALIYVENPNIDAVASYAPYTFTIYDEKNAVIGVRKGATILPKNKTVGIFEGGIEITESVVPRRAVFEFGSNIVWKKVDTTDPDITISHGPLLRLDSAPRVEANIKNEEIDAVYNIELVAAVFDGADNAIATSRTFVEELGGGENTNVVFTWPRPFDLGVRTCEKPSSVVLAIDKSGSMASLGLNPPEPLTSVKKAATYFISELKEKDSAGLVVFANSGEPLIGLTQNLESLIELVGGISISGGGTQYTNIADAVEKSADILIQKPEESSGDTQKVLVLLTDGVATRPQNPSGSKNEAEEIAYAESVALAEAEVAKKQGVMIYTIGLGKEIHGNFLKSLASSPDGFFETPSTSTLQSVYQKISTSICKELPSRIEITYKIFGDLI
ncbi:MAG TPA: vWA domain-containing protein [Candidatus Paceibacterota bacterium]